MVTADMRILSLILSLDYHLTTQRSDYDQYCQAQTVGTRKRSDKSPFPTQRLIFGLTGLYACGASNNLNLLTCLNRKPNLLKLSKGQIFDTDEDSCRVQVIMLTAISVDGKSRNCIQDPRRMMDIS